MRIIQLNYTAHKILAEKPGCKKPPWTILVRLFSSVENHSLKNCFYQSFFCTHKKVICKNIMRITVKLFIVITYYTIWKKECLHLKPTVIYGST